MNKEDVDMDLKDLRKWVDEYGLIFKVRYAPNSGCEVRVHKQGHSNPFVMIVRDDCVKALTDVDYMLWRILVSGGDEHVSEEHI